MASIDHAIVDTLQRSRRARLPLTAKSLLTTADDVKAPWQGFIMFLRES